MKHCEEFEFWTKSDSLLPQMSTLLQFSGLLESVYWTAMCCCGGRSNDVDADVDEDGKPEKTNFNKCCNWLFFYNPLLFPFTLVAW